MLPGILNTDKEEVLLSQGPLALSRLSAKCRVREILEYIHYQQSSGV